MTSFSRLLDLDQATMDRARQLAAQAGEPVVTVARNHTTVSVERATLRLAGLGGADHDGEPWVNHLVDSVRQQVGLEHGAVLPVWDALAEGGTVTAPYTTPPWGGTFGMVTDRYGVDWMVMCNDGPGDAPTVES